MGARGEQVDARIAALSARFGDRLTAEDLQEVRNSVEATLELAAALQDANLDQTVEPTLYPWEE